MWPTVVSYAVSYLFIALFIAIVGVNHNHPLLLPARRSFPFEYPVSD